MVGPPSDFRSDGGFCFILSNGEKMRTFSQVLKEERGLFITFTVLILLGLGCLVFALVK